MSPKRDEKKKKKSKSTKRESEKEKMKGWTKRYWEQYDKDNPQPPYKQASLDSAMGLSRIENRSAVSGRQRQLAAAEKKRARTVPQAAGMVNIRSSYVCWFSFHRYGVGKLTLKDFWSSPG